MVISFYILILEKSLVHNYRIWNEYLQSFKDYQEAYDVGILKAVLSKRNAYGEANISGKGVIEGDNPKAKKEVNDLTDEILQIIKSL